MSWKRCSCSYCYHTAYVCWTQILRETEAVGHMAPGSTSAQGPSHKRTEAKLVLQLATWMANTGQGAKSDITGLPQASNLSSHTMCLFRHPSS